MLRQLSYEHSRKVVTGLIETWLPGGDENAIRYVAGYLFDAGRIIPLAEFCLLSSGLHSAMKRAALVPGDSVMLYVERSSAVFQGSMEEIADIILSVSKGDASVVLFDETHQWALAINHSGAISILGATS